MSTKSLRILRSKQEKLMRQLSSIHAAEQGLKHGKADAMVGSRNEINTSPKHGGFTHPHHAEYLSRMAGLNFGVKLRIANGEAAKS